MSVVGLQRCRKNNDDQKVNPNSSSVQHAVNKFFGSKDMETRYEIMSLISRGTYGKVYRAWDKKIGKVVAIKHEFHGFSKSTLSEINIHKSLPRHPSIVGFEGVFVNQCNHVLVVMDYIETDLKRYMDSWEKPLKNLNPVKFFMKQILEGVRFLHENALMHRDLKPSNILMNNNFQLKICDFGLSRRIRDDDSGLYTPHVGTFWYKAPELLIGSNDYSSAIDIWSVGCIMAELILKEVLFKGNSEIDQLGKITNMLRSSANHNLWLKFGVATVFNGAPLLGESGIDLLAKLLAFDPNERITAEAALNHHWFRC